MRAIGMIVEYNPFHRGHKLHLLEAKSRAQCPFTIAVMSGNFLQRGEPALFDKWHRAQMAVLAGVDLVLELPAAFAVRSAAYFAAGGIRLLDSLGVVTHVCFGAENDDLAILTNAAAAINDPQVITQLHTGLKAGYTYAAALSNALQTKGSTAIALSSAPNNILAIEYIRAIQKFAQSLIPLPIKRQYTNYHDNTITHGYASALAIRRSLLTYGKLTGDITQTLPPTSLQIINELLDARHGPVTLAGLEQIILAKLRSTNLDHVASLPDVGEGLHHTIHDRALLAADLNELLVSCKSKRYPRTRLQRILIHCLLGTTKEQLQHWDTVGPLYARVLAFNEHGRSLLKEISQKSTIPIITKTAKFLNSRVRSCGPLNDLQQMLALDTKASDLYVLGFPGVQWRAGGLDFRQSPLYIAHPSG